MNDALPAPTWLDVEYRLISTGHLKARLYIPQTTRPSSAVISVHGGAWVAGDRLKDDRLNHHLACSGIFVMSIDMQKPPMGRYPGPATDVIYALQWLQDHATDYRIEPHKIGILGCSSGGHLALLAGLCPSAYRPAELDTASALIEVAFLATCWPIVDPVARFKMARDRGLEKLVSAHESFFGKT